MEINWWALMLFWRSESEKIPEATVVVVASYEKLMRSLGKELNIEFIDE